MRSGCCSQDGSTHWGVQHPPAGWPAAAPFPDHGFNFLAQLFGQTAENGVWVVPGTHRSGRLDVAALVAAHGERLPGAVPTVAAAGDVVMQNRNALHGSFANTSAQRRVTLNFGFHPRHAVLGAAWVGNALYPAAAGHTEEAVYARSQIIALAIDARCDASQRASNISCCNSRVLSNDPRCGHAVVSWRRRQREGSREQPYHYAPVAPMRWDASSTACQEIMQLPALRL